MIKNSPLFIQKIMTLVLFLIFLEFLSTIIGLARTGDDSQAVILALLFGFLVVGLIYFTLIHFCIKRKNFARIILVIFGILGSLASVYNLMTENYLMAEVIFTLVGIFLDAYIIFLLLGNQANRFFKSGDVGEVVEGSYKTWFSALSSILFVVVMGAKFLNKNEINNKSSSVSQSVEHQNSDDINSVKMDDSHVNEEDVESHSQQFEKLECDAPDVVAEFTDTMNNSPSALSNHVRIVDVDNIKEVSFTPNPYALLCSMTFTLNDSSEVNYIMKIYDKNGKGKMMIEGTPLETDAW